MAHIEDIQSGIEREQKDGWHVVTACEEDCEGWFSWSPCELCGSPLGGNRHRAAIIKPGKKTKPIYFDICVCCMCYLANGDQCDCKV